MIFVLQKIDLDTVDYAEDGKRDLISREIGKFREIMKVCICSLLYIVSYACFDFYIYFFMFWSNSSKLSGRVRTFARYGVKKFCSILQHFH